MQANVYLTLQVLHHVISVYGHTCKMANLDPHPHYRTLVEFEEPDDAEWVRSHLINPSASLTTVPTLSVMLAYEASFKFGALPAHPCSAAAGVACPHDAADQWSSNSLCIGRFSE